MQISCEIYSQVIVRGLNQNMKILQNLGNLRSSECKVRKQKCTVVTKFMHEEKQRPMRGRSEVAGDCTGSVGAARRSIWAQNGVVGCGGMCGGAGVERWGVKRWGHGATP